MRGIAVLVGLVGVVAGQVRRVEACSFVGCGPSFFVPDDLAVVPANIPGLFWRQMGGVYGRGDPQYVTFSTTNPAVAQDFTVVDIEGELDRLLVPVQPLVEGTSYELVDSNECGNEAFPGTPDRVTFRVGPATPLPSDLGTLTVSYGEGALEVWTSSGTCTSMVEASFADISLEMTAEASPWRDALHFETIIDGMPWKSGIDTGWRGPGQNGQGRGRERVFRICRTEDTAVYPGVNGGVHQVVFRASLPGTNIAVETVPVAIDLACSPLPPEPEPPPGEDVLPSDGACSTSGSSTFGWLALVFALFLRRQRGSQRRG